MRRGIAGLALVTLVFTACGSGGGNGGASGLPSASPSPSPAAERPSSPADLAIVQPRTGRVVEGSTVLLQVSLEGAKLVPQTTTDISPDEGHLHVLLDDQLISMTEGLEQDDHRRRTREPPHHRRVRGERSRPVRPARGLRRGLRGAALSALDPRAERSDRPILPLVVVSAGIVALVARPFVVAGPNARIGLLAATYAAILLACVAVPVPPGSARLPGPAVVAVGLGAVAAVGLVAGPGVPVPWGPAALPLSLLAAVAEEALFRRVAYAKLERFGVVAGDRRHGLPVRARPPACVRPRGAPRRPRRRPVASDGSAGRPGSWTAPAATHAAANLWVILG